MHHAIGADDTAFCHGELPASRLVFAAVMGIPFFLTLAPKVRPVAKMFGTANMAMRFDIAMLVRQVGVGLWRSLGGPSVQSGQQLKPLLAYRYRAGR